MSTMTVPIKAVGIFPPIGIARVGDASKGEEYFFAPEVPRQTGYPLGPDGNPITSFRSNGQIKQQAVKFRVYGFDENGICIKELTNHDYKLTWTVNVANTKAAALTFRGRYAPETETLRNPEVKGPEREKLKIKSEATINSDELTEKLLVGEFLGKKVRLGSLTIDPRSGCLIFRGGYGHAEHVKNDVVSKPEIESAFDNAAWYDDVCDGWVNVTVESRTGSGIKWTRSAEHKATVISAVPKFAWGINDTTTLYDVIEDIYKPAKHPATSFYRDIWPVLFNSCAVAWTSENANTGHGKQKKGYFIDKEPELSTPTADDGSDSHKDLRQKIFKRLREPGNAQPALTKNMPRLSGDIGDGSLTGLQYERFGDWANGKFAKGDPFPKTLKDTQIAFHPEVLTRAALEQAIGTAMYPGIEVYWIAKDAKTYDIRKSQVNPPFRINYPDVKPGDLTARLSLPWQSDFYLCSSTWWPATRPYDVVRSGSGPGETRVKWTEGLGGSALHSGNTDMVRYWDKLGFVVKDAIEFKWTEKERQTIPKTSS